MVSAKIIVVFLFACLVVVAQAQYGPKCPVKEEAKDQMQAVTEKCSGESEAERCLCIAKATGVVSEDESSFSVDKAVGMLDMVDVDAETKEAVKKGIEECGSSATNVEEFLTCSKKATKEQCN